MRPRFFADLDAIPEPKTLPAVSGSGITAPTADICIVCRQIVDPWRDHVDPETGFYTCEDALSDPPQDAPAQTA